MRKKAIQFKAIWLISAVCSWGVAAIAALPSSASPLAEAQLFPVDLAQTRISPPVPPLPTPLPAPQAPAIDGIVGLLPEPTDDIGIGHLRPRDLSFLNSPDWADSPYLTANWLQAAAIPIYIEPNGSHWGWIVNGWLVPNGQTPLALGRDASFSMLQTYYALFSFPVTEIRQDGWFQFQYTPVGNAWAHIDHLNLGSLDLAVETWENRFLDMGWVEYRQHGLSQSLNSAPNGNSGNILGLIGPNSFIEPLAFNGDWMQVRVTQPAEGCTVLPGAATQEGWMRWRNDDDGSLVWFPPKGC
ncbi:MAG: hypothetical protein AAGH67_00435 [Cyanobacteria bacterium P01_H01_bin.162]